jgi:hypothetical protein
MTAALLVYLVMIGAEPSASIDFATEIMPVLTKAGCNTGACHGAAAGRGGFRLSLLGGDAAADYEAIVHALEGRRINLAKPAESLLLKKPTGYLDHGGDVALPEESLAAAKILAWIKAGAPRGELHRLTEFQITPAQKISSAVPVTIRLTARARFDDGPWIDVTASTVFTPSDSAAVEILNSDNRISAVQKRRGRQIVIARFLDRVVSLELIVPLADQPIDLSAAPRVNFIDELILQQLTTLRLPLSPQANDATFLRRVQLDLTGRLPTTAEANLFLADQSTDKRTKLVDELLTSADFADYWTLRFARQLRLHSLPNEKEGAAAYAKWIREQLATNRPFNEWAHELLVATGDSHQIGPANFSRMVNDARGQAELVGDFFLGARLGCANCHSHPLDRWTQDDYHGFAAVFAKLERGRHVQLTTRGSVTNPRTGEPAVPRIPGVRDLPRIDDSLAVTAAWLVSSDNRLFARATVNRLWQAMFGRGLVEPVDDLRETNPATHPELLTRLADDFVQHGYDLRHTLRLIALSNAYGRSSEAVLGNENDDRYYSRAIRRPLGPEVLADAIADVTGVATEFSGQPSGTRAIALVDPLSPAPALDTLGRCSRAAGCSDQKLGGGLPAQLHLLNGELINRKLIDKQGRLQQLLATGASDEQIVQEFYLRGLSRKPSSDELKRWSNLLRTDEKAEHAERCEDFVWSLLNSREFVENH